MDDITIYFLYFSITNYFRELKSEKILILGSKGELEKIRISKDKNLKIYTDKY